MFWSMVRAWCFLQQNLRIVGAQAATTAAHAGAEAVDLHGAPLSTTSSVSIPAVNDGRPGRGVVTFLWDTLPNAVVVHGRRGANGNINGVYVRDYSWHNVNGPCYKRSGAVGRRLAIFLYLEGEWRMGPSPEEGSVWAFAPGDVPSPLQIRTSWKVWDGWQVVEDNELKISDTSVIPSVIYVFLTADGPSEVKPLQGMLLQQPGLFEGRPYYRHHAVQDFFLLCSVGEGRWRLGPLPVAGGGQTRSDNAILYAISASAIPQEIIEPWHMQGNESGHVQLADGVFMLSTTNSPPAKSASRSQYPLHIVVEGITAGDAITNGVYRRAPERLHQRPVYHKTDALRPASLWFSGDWRLGSSIKEGIVWAYASTTVDSPLAIKVPWQGLEDGQVEQEANLIDANKVILAVVVIIGERYVWSQKLCDARPVYQREAQQGGISMFLFFRAHLAEWWLGPVIGGSVCYAKASGSRFQVIPDVNQLIWQPVVGRVFGDQHLGITPSKNDAHSLPMLSSSTQRIIGGDVERRQLAIPMAGRWSSWWYACIVSVLLVILSLFWLVCPPLDSITSAVIVPDGTDVSRRLHRLSEESFTLVREESRNGVKSSNVLRKLSKPRSPKTTSALSCVVCFEAPREILLMPCRHVCCCQNCADRLERCPMCRAVKEDLAKVFL